MKDKIVLKNDTVIEIENGASLNKVQVVFQNKESMVSTWDELTNENLSEVRFENGSGVVIAEYANLVLVSVTSTEQSDGAILTSFALREKTEVELLREEMEEMKVVQEIQDGAIADLGMVVGEIAGGM